MNFKGTYVCYPELGNLSCKRGIPTEGFSIYVTGVLTLAFCSGVLNLMVIVAIAHYRQLHTCTNFILLNLAVSDFLVCAVLLPVDSTSRLFCWRAGDYACLFYLLFAFTLISVSTADMVLISVDRYVAICHPLHYSTYISQRSISVALVSCWILALCYGIGFYHNVVVNPSRYIYCKGTCFTVVSAVSDQVDFVVNYAGPFVIIAVLYFQVFLVAMTQARAMRSHVAAKTQRQGKILKKSELKAARNLGFVLLVFLMCYTTYYVISPRVEMNPYLKYTLFNLLYFNSCFNPILYALMYPWFRKAINQIVTLKVFKSGSCNMRLL